LKIKVAPVERSGELEPKHSSFGHSAWFVGVLAIMVYLIFAVALYLLPPAGTK
jgi:hypothetical protein